MGGAYSSQQSSGSGGAAVSTGSLGETATNFLLCGHRREAPLVDEPRAAAPLSKSDSFGALAHADPVDLVAAWVAARERGDARLATELCAEDLRFEASTEVGDIFELTGREEIADQIFETPAPPFAPDDVLRPLHLVAASSGGGEHRTSAYIVARELRLQHHRLRQEFTVISLKGWRNAMIILKIQVTRMLLSDEEIAIDL